jgi:3-deoxy-D-manno-octulosonate 8-phosphate phosphatase (KDO 8-P phosphatase)
VGISHVICDADGSLTDGSVWFSESGDILRRFSTLDGHGFKLLEGHGIYVHILTGSNSQAIKNRAKWLNVPCTTSQDKAHWVMTFRDYNGLGHLGNVCFFGNDVIDLEAMKLCGLAVCPHNAHPTVLEYCYSQGFVTMNNGGHGAFRELVDFLINSNFEI